MDKNCIDPPQGNIREGEKAEPAHTKADPVEVIRPTQTPPLRQKPPGRAGE